MDGRADTSVSTATASNKRRRTDPLEKVFAELKAEARKQGVTDQDIDDELGAYNAENRLP
jgi:hypothetical protein